MRAFRKVVSRIMRRLPRALRLPAVTVRSSSAGSFKLARPFDTTLGNSFYVNGDTALEPETISVFRALIQGTDCFFDVGANIGYYTLLAKVWRPTLNVVAFEPEKRAYLPLAESLRINNWINTKAENLALTDLNGEIDLYVPGAESEASTNPEFRPGAVCERCNARTLDFYCREHSIDNLNLIKIDTESTEPRVIRGGKEVIGDCKPDIICEVLKGRTERELMELLSPFGYRYYHLTDRGMVQKDAIQGDSNYRHLNYLFTSRRGE